MRARAGAPPRRVGPAGQAAGVDTVEVQWVAEPYAWTAAVASGRITDPGVTGRR